MSAFSLGRQQAHQLGEHYAAYPLDAVFCSDLQRAYRTAEIAFSARNVPIISDVRLRETDYGERTQCPRSQLGLEQHITEPFPNGESLFMAVQRVGDFLRETLRDHDGKIVVVIGVATRHGLEYWSSDASVEEIVAATWNGAISSGAMNYRNLCGVLELSC
jgi:broad specificity phosphatase PhoE